LPTDTSSSPQRGAGAPARTRLGASSSRFPQGTRPPARRAGPTQAAQREVARRRGRRSRATPAAQGSQGWARRRSPVGHSTGVRTRHPAPQAAPPRTPGRRAAEIGPDARRASRSHRSIAGGYVRMRTGAAQRRRRSDIGGASGVTERAAAAPAW
jgi:hypothetical protein